MKPKYIVYTLYEGHCPKCGDYQNSRFPEDVDRICIECKRKIVKEALIRKDIVIYKIEGNEIEGYRIHIKSKGKEYVIEAKDFKEGV